MSEKELLSLWKNGQTFSTLATVHFKSRDVPQFPSTQSDFDEQTARLTRLNDGLLAGKFIAFGFPEPKRIGDVPHIIPRDAWEPDEMNRNLVEVSMNNRLEYDGLYFTDIRVVSPQSHIIKTDGRPTLGPILTDISTEMKNAGDIDVTRQQKDHFAVLREKAAIKYPMHKARIENASSRTLAKYFSPVFNSLKASLE